MAKRKKPSNPEPLDETTSRPSPEGSSPSTIIFIPHELDISDRPDLHKLPANVLFAAVGTNARGPVMGTALYEPELSSLNCGENQCSLTYQNKLGADCWLRITYYTDKLTWEGEKSVGGETVGIAFGADWKEFFTQLGLMGLAKGEPCEMERLPEASTST